MPVSEGAAWLEETTVDGRVMRSVNVDVMSGESAVSVDSVSIK